ncbi:MAG: hypothetical protein EHM64_08745 [Ignavibacteriae bacterium]|nr:MAG: hypothetical protein EHM64_08745 [Ignavibacteriota bacterium]
MFQIFKHIASVFLIAAYFCGSTIAPAIEKTSHQPQTKNTISFKVGWSNAQPLATSSTAKAPQRIVKTKERLFFSPVLAERLCTHQALDSGFRIPHSDSKCACLFMACSSLSERAPPAFS